MKIARRELQPRLKPQGELFSAGVKPFVMGREIQPPTFSSGKGSWSVLAQKMSIPSGSAINAPTRNTTESCVTDRPSCSGTWR